VWRVALHIVLVGLVSGHEIQKHLPVNASFGVTIGCHVSRVAPLNGPDDSQLK
jgi:hypothetical protein